MNNINNESDFENHIRQIIIPLLSFSESYKIFDFKKAVDILIARNGAKPKLFFIEIKYHKKSHGRLGFGHGGGKGFQPEVLKERIDYFEDNLRWILGHEDSEEYWFADNETIREYLNGDRVAEKYNGIKTNIFNKITPKSKKELILELNQWLKS